MAFVYQPASGLAQAARLALWADALTAAIAVALALAMGMDALIWGDLAGIVSALRLLTWLASLALFLTWFYRANANARAMGAEDLMGSPGLAVGWFFIPLAWFFMPYIGVRDTWKASEAPRDWQARRASPLIGFWWAGMLVANVASLVAARIAAEGGYDADAAVGVLGLISNTAAVAAGLLGAQLVAAIQRRQVSPAHLSETFR